MPRRRSRTCSQAGNGSIINTASTLGLIGSEGYAAYGAAKAGLVALTRQIAVEYGPIVRANVIAPGSIDTPRFRKVTEQPTTREVPRGCSMANVPLDALGTADDIAAHRALPRQRPRRRTPRAR